MFSIIFCLVFEAWHSLWTYPDSQAKIVVNFLFQISTTNFWQNLSFFFLISTYTLKNDSVKEDRGTHDDKVLCEDATLFQLNPTNQSSSLLKSDLIVKENILLIIY